MSESGGAATEPAGLAARFATAIADSVVLRVVLRRLLFAVPLLALVSLLSFVLVSLTPGDAAQEILGANNLDPVTYAKLRHQLGLDQPLYEQYWHWVEHALQGDLGRSLFSSQPVTQMIGQRLPTTLSLIGLSLLVIVVVGVCLGVFTAVRGGVAGRIVDGLGLVGFALPAFWAGAILIAIFAVRLRWLPATGYVPVTQSPLEWGRSLVLPVVSLGLHGIAAMAKQTRDAMLDALASEHVRMARANGISERSIVFRHCLKNAGILAVTILGVQAVALLGGTVLVENVFALPGVGSLAVSTTLQHDLPVIQGIVVLFTLIVVAINLLIDLAYMSLNPRVRTQ